MVRRRLISYNNVNIRNFSSSFKDGLAFCALIHSYHPSRIPYSSLKADNAAKNLEIAFAAAEKLGIERLLDVEDMMLPRPEPK